MTAPLALLPAVISPPTFTGSRNQLAEEIAMCERVLAEKWYPVEDRGDLRRMSLYRDGAREQLRAARAESAIESMKAELRAAGAALAAAREVARAERWDRRWSEAFRSRMVVDARSSRRWWVCDERVRRARARVDRARRGLTAVPVPEPAA